ncbi:phosphatase PAP2 family protein [Heyndrickxia sp. NPDC080065]|uniref:phosphatase PAP2 family protein n=1 Tax=Heyndrickxia sp. NPDC080065 TaxID=3390568 RepID=UPI003CFF0CCE
MKTRAIWLGAIEIILLGIFIWGFFAIATSFNGPEIHKFDYNIISIVQSNISDRLTSIMLFITFFGSVKGVAIITALVIIALFITRHRLLSLFLMVTIGLGAGVFNKILKLYFKRERPDIQPIIQEHGYSFPSGHSMGSMILYGSLAFILFKVFNHTWAKIVGAIFGIVMIFAIGISRIYLGVHYPSDVVGGYIAGAFWLLICIITFSFVEKWKKKGLKS